MKRHGIHTRKLVAIFAVLALFLRASVTFADQPVYRDIESSWPRIIRRVDPDFRGLLKAVHVEVTINEAGLVTNARIVATSHVPRLDVRVLKAVRQWKFETQEIRGRAERAQYTFSISSTQNRWQRNKPFSLRVSGESAAIGLDSHPSTAQCGNFIEVNRPVDL